MLLLSLLVLGVVGGVLCDGNDEARHYPAEYHHHEVIELSEPSAEGYYHTRVRPQKSGPDTLTSIGILALLKLLILKTKAIGIAIILLLKLPILLIILLTKLLFAVKLFKLAKLALIPLFLPLLIPLLLGPLLLLPLLLPLLLLLPIPVLQPTTAAPAAGRRKREIPAMPYPQRPYTVLHTLRQVLESEHCLERIACQIAAHRQPSIYAYFISWTLDKMKIYVDHPRFESYILAYEKARNSAQPECSAYTCSNKSLNMF